MEYKALEKAPYGMVTEYTMWKVNSDVIIMGASEANHSYIPSLLEEKLGMTVYNCGKNGCRFYYQHAMINGILDRYNPKLIIWSISPNELCTPTEEDRGNLSKLNPFYYEKEFVNKALRTKSPFEPIKLLSNSYSFNSKLFYYLNYIYISDEISEYGGYEPLYKKQKNLNIVEAEWNGNYDSTINDVFNKTIERCINQNVPVIFVFTPRFERENHDELESYKKLKQSVNMYKIPIIEDLYHIDVLMKKEYFKDNAHLNHDGAIIFNNLLVEKLDSLLHSSMN